MNRRGGASSTEPLSTKTIWIFGAGLLAVFVASVGLLVWPLQVVPPSPSGGRLESLKTALSIVAAAGVAVTLALAARRQRHNEQTARSVEFDAAERRVTELYTKSVEQLGSDTPTVRIGALHALKRLGDNNQSQRQAIADLACSYLRMPFEVPDVEITHRARSDLNFEGTQDARSLLLAKLAGRPGSSEAAQELQVRITAQDILTRSLCRTPELDEFDPWDVALDLSHATLVDFQLTDATLRSARFTSCKFLGDTSFTRTRFLGPADFSGSNCSGALTLTDCAFDSSTYFFDMTSVDLLAWSRCTFLENTRFAEIDVDGNFSLTESVFKRILNLQTCRFEELEFIDVSCEGEVYISQLTGDELAGWRSAFKSDVSFAHLRLNSPADFEDAEFHKNVVVVLRSDREQLDLSEASFREGAGLEVRH